MSHNEESSPPETEGEEIRSIVLSTSNSHPNENYEKPNDDALKEITGGRNDDKSKDARRARKENEEVAVSSSHSSNNDICRICHMGRSRSHQSHLSAGERGNQDANASSSANLNLGRLVSACRCRGTVGLVHTKCLERWLTESGHTRCELCGYRYATIRVPRHGLLRSLCIWIRTYLLTRQAWANDTLVTILDCLSIFKVFLDSLYLFVTTPLAVFSAYVCAMTLKMALENRIGEIPWTIVAMLPTCSLTLVAYWGWLLTLQRLHGRRWRQYWQSNFIVQLVPDSPIVPELVNEEQDVLPTGNLDEEDDAFVDLPDLFNVM